MTARHIQSQYAQLFSDSAAITITDGWFWLVSGLCQELAHYQAKAPMQAPLAIRLVEERLGIICVHYSGGNAETSKIVRAVQMVSTMVCQLCGETEHTGNIYETGVKTICKKCWKANGDFRATHILPHTFSEEARQEIGTALRLMHEGWFRTQLEKII
jgi:hypothetical protein